MLVLAYLCLSLLPYQEAKDKEARRQEAIQQSEKDQKNQESKLARYQKAAVNSIIAAKGMVVKNGQIYFRSAKEKNEAIESQKLVVADSKRTLEEFKEGKIPPPVFKEFLLPLQTGQFGYLIKDAPIVEVLAIVDQKTIIANVMIKRLYRGGIKNELVGIKEEDVRLIIRDIKTTDVTDGERFRATMLFEVKGTVKLGGSTMFVISPIDPKDAAIKAK